MQLYEVDRTKWEGMNTKERKTVRCSYLELADMLTDSKYTVWSARWVNPTLDKPKERV